RRSSISCSELSTSISGWQGSALKRARLSVSTAIWFAQFLKHEAYIFTGLPCVTDAAVCQQQKEDSNMDIANDSVATEQQWNHALDANTSDELDAPLMRAKRLALIDAYEEEALDRKDPQDALLGASTAVLHRLTADLGEALIEYCD